MAIRDYCEEFIMRSLNVILLSIVFISLNSKAYTQDNSSSFNLELLIACQNISGDADRLACFDENVSAFSKATEQGEIVTIKKETVEKVERESFGFNLPSIPKLSSLFGLSNGETKAGDSVDAVVDTAEVKIDSKKIDKPKKPKKKDAVREAALGTQEISLTINRVGRHEGRKLKFLFSNGQIWEQTDSEILPGVKSGGGKGKEVVITKGNLGSFFLRVNGKGRAIKVKRAR